MARRKEPDLRLDFSKGVRGKYAVRYSKPSNIVPGASEAASSVDTKVPEACLSCRLLRYVRDKAPTEDEFIAWLGGPSMAGIYHALRKSRLLLIEKDRLRLAPSYFSDDGKRFSYGHAIFNLDTDEVWRVRR